MERETHEIEIRTGNENASDNCMEKHVFLTIPADINKVHFNLAYMFGKPLYVVPIVLVAAIPCTNVEKMRLPVNYTKHKSATMVIQHFD